MSNTFEFLRYNYNHYKKFERRLRVGCGNFLKLLSSALPKHSTTQAKLIIQAGNSLNNNLSNYTRILFTEFRLKINDKTVFRRSIMVICGQVNDDILEFSLLLITEIFSPFNLKTDRITKFDLYRENGVKYYLW